MADASIDLQASNIFSLPANFNTQSSTSTTGTQNVATNDEKGNVACQRNITEQTDYTQSATYCGSDFVNDFLDYLNEFGEIFGVGAITQLSINMSAGEYATVEITGHNHEVNPHTSMQSASMLPFFPAGAGEPFENWDGFGVPTLITTGADSSPSSSTITLTMNHVDVNDESGDHLVGKSITPRYEQTIDFEGVPTSSTAALIEADYLALVPLDPVFVDSVDTNDSNSEFDTFSTALHANVDLQIP